MISNDVIISPTQVKAARALRALSQQDLASAAGVATSTVADFERGARTPVQNNTQAIRLALEAMGLRFVEGGVTEISSKQGPQLRAGTVVSWVNATQLSQWGKSRDAQGALPDLIRRLVLATAGPPRVLHFKWGDSVQREGWDGILESDSEAEFIPSGVSGWELTTQSGGIRGKADDDFNKRSENPLGLTPHRSTFVFATVHAFANKADWINQKRERGIWRDVRVIDGDDLAHWLGQTPIVAFWLAARIGSRPHGVSSLDEHWGQWSSATRPRFTTEMTLASREEDTTVVHRWLHNEPASLSIQAESSDEAIAVLYAALSRFPEEHQRTLLDRCIIANTQEATKTLYYSIQRLIVILTDPEPGDVTSLVDKGHHVFCAFGPEASNHRDIRRLGRPWPQDLEEALRNAGLAEDKAEAMARDSGRSLVILRRLLAMPGVKPSWARTPSPSLIAAMFAGSWRDKDQYDQEILSRLANRPYETIVDDLTRLSGMGDGPIRLSGDVWKIRSLRDLWFQIGSQVTDRDLERYEEALRKIFITDHPERALSVSDGLRHGLTESLLPLALHPEVALQTTRAQSLPERIVRALLDGASAEAWRSLSSVFRNLAEAAPTAFLRALEDASEGEAPQILSILDWKDSFLSGSDLIYRLCWSLEMLARSDEYMPRVARLLARLEDLNSDTKNSRTPFEVLNKIFLLWAPQTAANRTTRTKTLEEILAEHNRVGWRLLLALAPSMHQVLFPSARPRWRDFSIDDAKPRTRGELMDAVQEIGRLLLEHVGGDLDRWNDLLKIWQNFEPEWRRGATQRLDAWGRSLNEPSHREALRNHLRSFLRDHRRSETAQWSLPEEELAPIEQLYASLEPEDLESRHRWVFQTKAVEPTRNETWEGHRARLETRQTQAAEELIGALSLDQVMTFACKVELTHALGSAIARAEIAEETRIEALRRSLCSDQPHLRALGSGLVWGLRESAADVDDQDRIVTECWRRAIDEAWGEAAEIEIALLLSMSQFNWDAIEARSPSIAQAYWQRLPHIWIPKVSDADYVTTKLLQVERPWDAADWLEWHIDKKPSAQTVVNVLEAISVINREDKKLRKSNKIHSIGILIEYLQNQECFDEFKIISLEIKLFEELQFSQFSPKTLHRAIARDPSIFVDLIKVIYLRRSDQDIGAVSSDDGVELPYDRNTAYGILSTAFGGLGGFGRVPGSNEAGEIDPARLNRWIDDARRLLAEAGRLETGDHKIGELLASVGPALSEDWLPDAVCAAIQRAKSREMESGFFVGLYNRRGVTSRGPYEGGAQERDLAARYRRDAERVRVRWPRVADCLEQLAKAYENQADWEDRIADGMDGG